MPIHMRLPKMKGFRNRREILVRTVSVLLERGGVPGRSVFAAAANVRDNVHTRAAAIIPAGQP